MHHSLCRWLCVRGGGGTCAIASEAPARRGRGAACYTTVVRCAKPGDMCHPHTSAPIKWPPPRPAQLLLHGQRGCAATQPPVGTQVQAAAAAGQLSLPPHRELPHTTQPTPTLHSLCTGPASQGANHHASPPRMCCVHACPCTFTFTCHALTCRGGGAATHSMPRPPGCCSSHPPAAAWGVDSRRHAPATGQGRRQGRPANPWPPRQGMPRKHAGRGAMQGRAGGRAGSRRQAPDQRWTRSRGAGSKELVDPGARAPRAWRCRPRSAGPGGTATVHRV
jgi:hypothetical protein